MRPFVRRSARLSARPPPWARRWTRRTRGNARVDEPGGEAPSPRPRGRGFEPLRRRHTRDVAAWERHDVEWAAFEARAARAADGDGVAAASVDDVPWPPTRDPRDALSALAAIEAARARGGNRTGNIGDARRVVAAAHRRAFRRLSLRWHPDKFHARSEPRFEPAGRGARDGLLEGETHADAISRRVYDVAQGVNDAWTAFQAQWIRP